MPALTYEHHDFGDPYKLFKELKDGDKIYSIDYENIDIKEHKISKVSIEDISDNFSKNRFKVEFEISNNPLQYSDKIKILDGNTFISKEWDGRNSFYFTTDERIAKVMCDLLYSRNEYQWNTFTSLFGNPMGNYETKPVILK